MLAPAALLAAVTGVGIVPFVFSVGVFSASVAVSDVVDLPLRVPTFVAHLVAGLVALIVATLARIALWAVVPLRWTDAVAQVELLRTTAATAALWLAAALPGVSVGPAAAWRQALALVVLARLIVVLRITVNLTQSYGSGSGWGSYHGSGGYLAGSSTYTETTTSYVRATEPFVPNLVVTAAPGGQHQHQHRQNHRDHHQVGQRALVAATRDRRTDRDPRMSGSLSSRCSVHR